MENKPDPPAVVVVDAPAGAFVEAPNKPVVLALVVAGLLGNKDDALDAGWLLPRPKTLMFAVGSNGALAAAC